MAEKKYVIGVDYGTDSVRSVIVNTQNGKELASSVFDYPRWKAGKYCAPAHHQFRQHPLDYTEGLIETIRTALGECAEGTNQQIVAISVDTTGSTPVAVDKQGTPLALKPEFSKNPNAMFVLWKDHTATKEATQINDLARTWGGTNYTKYEGGVYSSEWFWAKILHVLRTDKDVARATFSWLEHCDWIPALLTGNNNPLEVKRSRCAAGHKAMWHPEWDGLPSEKFLVKLDPLLKGLRSRLYTKTYSSETKAGNLSPEWAEKLGLTTDVAVGVGAFDAHLGAVGGEIEPYYLSKVMGTSTCDMMISPKDQVGDTLVQGICGQVDGSITPDLIGLEAGQSAFGDIYAWFRDMLLWPIKELADSNGLLKNIDKEKLIAQMADKIIPALSDAAEKIPVEESAPVALDWMNGRRTPNANQNLKGAITGLTLGSDAPRVFRALVESTAFGAKAIVEHMIKQGVRIDGIIALGGVAKKSPFVMQIVADVLNKPIKIARSEQTCALGAAMAASVVSGIYDSFQHAQKNMGSGFEKEYRPNVDKAKTYQRLYEKYIKLGEFIENEFTNK